MKCNKMKFLIFTELINAYSDRIIGCIYFQYDVLFWVEYR
jgi:hypothetical protein